MYSIHSRRKQRWEDWSDGLKGQLISKSKCQAKDSSKKRTNEFAFTSMRRVFVRFLEESSARKKMFRDHLTFSTYTQIFSPKNLVLPCKKILPNFFWLVYLNSMQLFSADPKIFSKEKKILVNTKKNGPQNLLIISPKLFFHSPAQPKIDLSYYKYVARLICLLICDSICADSWS